MRILRVRPAEFCSRYFVLLHDNAPTHKSNLPIFDPKEVATIYHSLYSPGLSPTDYFLYPKLKIKLKELHFADLAEIQEAITTELKKVQKEEFLAAFQKLYDRARVYIYASGANFELKK
jgi:hypothetical protein